MGINTAISAQSKEMDSVSYPIFNKKEIIADTNYQILDSLPILQSSLKIYYKKDTLGAKDYSILYHQIAFSEKWQHKKLTVIYKTYPFDFEKESFLVDSGLIRFDVPEQMKMYVLDKNSNTTFRLFDDSRLKYSGSFERGIMAGNQGNMSLNSNFRLQINGDIGNGIQLEAAINDDNLPIQPEGNTQQIQEFDQIYVQLKKDAYGLVAGDFDLKQGDNYFIKYFKRLQGLNFKYDDKQLKADVAMAISRGQFQRYNLPIKEGIQGPYRLQGANNESFIIVLAGSERIYYDGRLLKRGFDQDYVMDYNTGEITFSPKTLIKQESRIIVEFEYSTQQYNRSLATAKVDYQLNKKWRLYSNYYSEQDSKNSLKGFILNDEQKAILASSGDQSDGIFLPSLSTFNDENAENITYAQKDTLVDGNTFPIISYRTFGDSLYTARFTDVGQGNGNYILSTQNTANGRVYEWVAPINGQAQGSYEPLIKLVPPVLKRMANLGVNFETKNSYFNIETALSRYDLNRFSIADKANDQAIAFYVNGGQTFDLDSIGRQQTGVEIQYEFKQKDFTFINPYRAPEFTRDWNINNNLLADEHFVRSQFYYKNGKALKITYALNTFLQDSFYQGFKQKALVNLDHKGWQLQSESSLLNSTSLTDVSTYWTQKTNMVKKWTQVETGLRFLLERNQRNALANDSLMANSFYFLEYEPYVTFQWNEKTGDQIRLSYLGRKEWLPSETEFQAASNVEEYRIQWTWNSIPWSKLQANFTYRNRSSQDTTLTDNLTYNGLLNHRLKLLDGGIQLQTQYALTSGQAPKREFVYQQVPQGQGLYTWVDRNEDGIEQLDEFEIALFPEDANYLKLYTFNNEYILTNNLDFNQSFILRPSTWIANKSHFLNKVTLESFYKLNKKTDAASPNVGFSPYDLSNNANTLVRSYNWRNSLKTRWNKNINTEIYHSDRSFRSLLISGIDETSTLAYGSTAKWNINRQWALSPSFIWSEEQSLSENFEQRNFSYQSSIPSIRLTYKGQGTWNTEWTYEYNNSGGESLGVDQELEGNSLIWATQWQSKKLGRWRLNLEYDDLIFVGTVNSPVQYSLLQGKQPNKNYSWVLNWEKPLGKAFKLNLGYTGRKLGSSKTRHTLQATIRAIF